MVKSATTAIIFGALLFALGMIPSVLATLTEGLQNFRDYLSSGRAPLQRFQTDFRRFGDIGLLVGGGVMMIAGLLALLLN